MYKFQSMFYRFWFILDSLSKVHFLPLLYTHHNFSKKKLYYPIFSVWKKYKDKFRLFSERSTSYRLPYFTFHSVSITYVDQAFNLRPSLLHILLLHGTVSISGLKDIANRKYSDRHEWNSYATPSNILRRGYHPIVFSAGFSKLHLLFTLNLHPSSYFSTYFPAHAAW